MKIAVGDYDSFKRVCAEVSPLTSVFYGRVGPTDVGPAAALTASRDQYVTVSSLSGTSVTTFLADFPSAIEALNVDLSY